MARQTIVMLTDDLDGGEAETTVSFAFDGMAYDIDLSGENAQQFREVMSKYLAAGTRKGRVTFASPVLYPRTGGSGGTKQPVDMQARVENRRIRQWGLERGYHLAERGRVPQHIVDAYRSGNVPQLQDALPNMPEVAEDSPEVVKDTAKAQPAKKAAPAKKANPVKTASSSRTNNLRGRTPVKAWGN